MDFFGIGVLELFFIVLIALIVLGPKDMVKMGRTMGRFVRKLMLSPGFMDAQRWVRNLPNQLMREAGIEEIQNDLRQEAERIRQETTVSVELPKVEPANTIAKPALTPPATTRAVPANPPLTPTPPFTATTQKEAPATPAPPNNGARQTYPSGTGNKEMEEIPPEWIPATASHATRVQVADADDYPIEWTRAPRETDRPITQDPGLTTQTNEIETRQE